MPVDADHQRMLESLQNVIGGEIIVRGEEFFLSNEKGDLVFSLLAEGWRKLGLLWLLIRNGTLQKGSVLFWDEPEANLNPKMFRVVINVLLELQRAGVQVFFATHDYVILKELDLQMTEEDRWRSIRCIGMRLARSRATVLGVTWTYTPMRLMKLSTTFTIVKSSAAWVG